MAVSIPGLSTLGVKFSYGCETVAGTKPETFKWLERCNTISGIALDTETIDASALEDFTTRSVAGRQDNGGTWSVTFNLTEEVRTQLEGMITEYLAAKEDGLSTWFQVTHPDMEDGFFVVAEPPRVLPMPEFGQNELQTIELTFTINEYKGQSAAVEPTTIAGVAVTGVSLNKSTTSISVGNSETLEATVAPASASNQEVTWTTTDTSVATVNSIGKVTGVGVGSAIIVVTTKDGGKTDTCSVTVS